MNIQIKNTSIIISDSDGSILSYKIGDVEFMAPGAEKRPLFMLKLLMDDGSPVYYSAKDAEKMYAELKCLFEEDVLPWLDQFQTRRDVIRVGQTGALRGMIRGNVYVNL